LVIPTNIARGNPVNLKGTSDWLRNLFFLVFLVH
jgi:hypothetical protein